MVGSNITHQDLEFTHHFEQVKKELDESLQLYRFVVVNDIQGDIPRMYKRLVRAQNKFDKALSALNA